MKKITFKVSLQKEHSVVSLLKEVNKISCRIYIDIEKGYVEVENVSDTMIDDVIELLDNYFTILCVEIDNTLEDNTEKQINSGVTEVSADKTDDSVVDNIEEVKKETTELIAGKQPTVLEPQTENDLIIRKVEFENEYVENRINNFLKTAYWALYKRHATEQVIGNYILTYMSEISMRYSSKPIIEFSVGDIVDVNYGYHLPGEIIGGHVHAIVCHILNENMAYVVPITKATDNVSSLTYLSMDTPQDAIYNNEYYTSGTVLVDKGKYVRVERFNSVIGKTKPEFFEELLYKLASAFDFTGYLIETDKSDEEVAKNPTEADTTVDEVVENFTETDETDDEVVETLTETDETDDKVEKTKTSVKKVGREEAALLETIGFALDKLDNSKTVEEQVESFLTDIGMTTIEKMIAKSFIIACDIEKINYDNVLLRLNGIYPYVEEKNMKNILKDEFKNWLNNHPILAEKCPRISFMTVLKVFAKRFE